MDNLARQAVRSDVSQLCKSKEWTCLDIVTQSAKTTRQIHCIPSDYFNTFLFCCSFL